MRLARSLAGYADVRDERNWITLSILAARVLGLTGACANDFLSRCPEADVSPLDGILTASEGGR